MASESHRISPLSSIEVLKRLGLVAPVRIDGVALALGLPPHRRSPRHALIIDTDRHGTVESDIFKIILGAAAFGSGGGIHEALQLNVTNGLVFWLRDLVCLILIERSVVELAQRAV